MKKLYGVNLFNDNNVNTKTVPGLGLFCDIHKPYTLKLIINGLRIIFNLYMQYYLGYTIYYDNLTNYKFYSKITNTDKQIYMFIHGLGIGTMQYLTMINKFDGQNIIYMDIPHISWQNNYDYLDDRILYITFENYIRQNKIKKLNLIGHSYGGVVSQKLLNKYENIIDKVYIIESPIFQSNIPYILNYLFNNKKLKFIYYLFIKTDLNVLQLASF